MDDLIERAAQGDRDSLSELVRQNYPGVYRFCVRRLGPELGQDAAQETFVTMQKSLKGYKGQGSFSTWLLGIAHNHVRNLSRRRKAEPLSLAEWIEDGDSPESGLIQRDLLRKALSRLSEDHRQAVLMHEIEGLSYQEIAAILQVPEGTIKSRLHHAFRSLRASLTEVTA